MKRPNILILISALVVACMSSAYAIQINEIRIDQPSADNDEYFELSGRAGESLNGLTYLVIGDGAGLSGTIEAVVSLSGQTLDASGLFVAGETSFSLTTANTTTNLNFENGDNVTHLLVSGFVGENNSDLDVDNDGIFDDLPWAYIEDSIALKNDDSEDLLYSSSIVSADNSGSLSHVYRCGDRWEIGDANPTSPGASDTPSIANPCAQQTLQINEIRIDQPSSDLDEYFELIGPAFLSLEGVSYIVIGDGAGGSGTVESVLDLSGQTINKGGLFTVAESTFTLATPDLKGSINFENGDNVTHLLVRDFNGAKADDLDTNDDGVLDITPWTEIIDSVALKDGDLGDFLYSDTIVGPVDSFVPGHVFRCEAGFKVGTFNPIDPDSKDTATSINDCGGVDDSSFAGVFIHEIQGASDVSPLTGQQVKTRGVVSGDFQGANAMNGFYIQSTRTDADANALTSEGIYVFDPNGTDLVVGDLVEVVATVEEFFGLTELTDVVSVTKIGRGSITPTAVILPESIDGELERYEGMLIEIVSNMTISQNFFVGRYGQLTLAANDSQSNASRLYQPTNQFKALSSEAINLAADNARRILILDDGQDISGFGDNPTPVPYLGFPATTLRVGDAVSNLVGILDYGRISPGTAPNRDYRLHPTQAPIFSQVNLREVSPADTGGRINVASFNVLNYFTGIDTGDSNCGPRADQGCRGADSISEFERQQAKIVNAMTAMDADVFGLVELENNGFGADSAAQSLTNAVNAQLGSKVYTIASINQQALGGDAITVGIIYKAAVLNTVGTPTTLTSGAFSQNLNSGRSRAPLAVSFEERASGEQFTMVVNHFKSKGSGPSGANDPNADQNDGQANWNLRRTQAAKDLASWLSTNPTGINDPDILIIGDLNAYAKEDPILALNSFGYTDLISRFSAGQPYSFIFDGQAGYLDHALANRQLLSQVTGVIEWHINADEPSVIDYNEDFNPQGYYSSKPYRSSDHDPLMVGLRLSSQKN